MSEQNAPMPLHKIIGPGLLFAGSAVGVSHLVQSTRSGATFGFGLVIFIIAIFVAKYPTFLFGPRYAAATGKSVLSGYRNQGKHALIFFGISTFCTMFIATAANMLVTSGLVKASFGIDLSTLQISIGLAVAGVTFLITGHYHWFDLVVKILIAFLTIATLAATALAIPMINWELSGQLFPSHYDVATALFIAALLGWMPTPSDVSIWQSQWSVAKMRDTGYRPSKKEARLDFHIGYITTFILAICFVILGAAVMHGSGTEFKAGAADFAAQVIGLYEQALGKWSGALVGLAALAVMFSTLLTIMDGFPRALANLLLIARDQEEQAEENPDHEKLRHTFYWCFMLLAVCGALLVISFFMGRFKLLVDFAATVSFLSAPVFAWFNHRAILGKEVPADARPGIALQSWSIVGVVALSGLAATYLYLVFIH
jgi:Mn2+/Fe2+ NRAMP family transporter